MKTQAGATTPESARCIQCARNDPYKYAEIVYLMSVLVEKHGLGGQAILDQWIKALQEKLSQDEAKDHSERFRGIYREEQKRFREELLAMQEKASDAR